MSESKFTPGPWEHIYAHGNCARIGKRLDGVSAEYNPYTASVEVVNTDCGDCPSIDKCVPCHSDLRKATMKARGETE
jgi:hypothetical protein